MKKMAFILSFVLLSLGAKGSGSITFFNTTMCTIQVALLADDDANYGGVHCTLASNFITVLPFTPITRNNTAHVASIEGWTNPWVAGAATWHWDGLRMLLPNGNGCSIGSSLTSCLIQMQMSCSSSAPCGSVTATYIPGTNDIVIFN